MRLLTIVLPYPSGFGDVSPVIQSFAGSSLVSRILTLHQGPAPKIEAPGKIQFIQMESYFSGTGMEQVLAAAPTDYLLLVLPGAQVTIGQRALERFLQVVEDTGAGLVYSDFRQAQDTGVLEHPTIDYQPGSLRDTFDFGSLVFISKKAAEQALKAHGRIDASLRWAGFYDLRLKISIDFPIVRIPESLYTTRSAYESASGEASYERMFAYVDPKNRDYQLEMEQVATAHLKRLGAFLEPEFSKLPPPEGDFSITASIVIPVRNRERTIADAVESALGQSAPVEYNVIVVDNHSTDETTDILRQLATQHKNLIHKIPARTDLGIGGCWNEAIYSPECGLYAVQLDSDDLYADAHVLERLISKFDEGGYAMVIGSYTTVGFNLEEIPPGLVDHCEWTRENGRNNALRIGGLGAPRAFYLPVLRRFGFPNVSYGEDYAVGLRISREYEIGRLFESVYLCRRWEDNTDRALPLKIMNRYEAYKDWLRTVEIQARRKIADVE
jgi:hypothetical protein